MIRFEHMLPTRVVFGRGRLEELGTIAAGLGRAVLVVCGRAAMRRTGTLDRALHVLESAGITVHAFEGVSPNPRSDEVDAAVTLARRHDCDLVVGLGGGSALDAAKAAAVAVGHEGGSGPLVGRTLSPSPRSLPIVAVPTTSGTGSEVSRGAIVLDVERRHKAGIRGDDLFPAVALIDPELAASMPAEVAVETGFDAFTHAVESYLAARATPLSDALAATALTDLGRLLPRLAAGDRSREVEDGMSLAALLGGLNVATASTCLPHRLQQAMGAVDRLAVAHARGLAMLYPAWIRHAYPFAPDRFDQVSAWLGRPPGPDGLAAFVDDVGMGSRLGDVGFVATDIDVLVANVTGNVDNDPTPNAGPDVFRSLYEASL